MKALREAITNAVMHRDWFMEGANVFVEIYSDRIEVSSPGGLPKGMKLSDLGRKIIRRNALVADMLHRIDFIEMAGTGIKRIRDEARAQGCPEPVFEETGFFTVTFYPNPEVRVQAEAQSPEATGQVPLKYPQSRPSSGSGSCSGARTGIPRGTPARGGAHRSQALSNGLS
jgi:ATP-dependent DNA helicase RecG